jgi:alpha-L-fucosidase
MTTTAVGTGLLQALDVVQNLSSQVILNLHVRKYGGQVENLLIGELADAAGWMDVEAGQEAGGSVAANAEKGLEGFLFIRPS